MVKYKANSIERSVMGLFRTHSKLKSETTKGFTIIELLIATTVFATVLLLCAFGLLQVSRVYQKGITSAKTQEVARSVSDSIARAIQFSGGTVVTTPPSTTDGVPFVFCIDDRRFTAVTDRQIKQVPSGTTQSKHALVTDTLIGCSGSSPVLPIATSTFDISTVSGAQELLSTNMRLARLEVASLGGNLYRVLVRIVHGEDDLLDATHDSCANVRAGGQFCAVSELSTVVQKRL